MSLPPFSEFFEAVHGYRPFEWQQDLATRLAAGEGVDVIDVPTGLGKTAVIDAAVYALAVRITLRPPSPTSMVDWLRLYFVVDRRLIVDATFDRAASLAHALRTSSSTSIAPVADALRGVSGDEPLVACRMRGGATWDWNWVARPSQPAVIVSTVDQFGSRLLFRGYGLSPRLRPIDAALCGTQALVVVDEAHLSGPLIEAVRDVTQYERARSALPGVRVIQMSATVPTDSAASVVRLDASAEQSETARRRLQARRELQLLEIANGDPDGVTLTHVMARAAVELHDREGVRLVAVVANTVARARALHELLCDLVDVPVTLVIGRSREFEREQVLGGLNRVTTGWRDRGDDMAPHIIVATQTIEVGADLDLDGLVTEAAPFDCLVQRLGRIDRGGHLGDTLNVAIADERLHLRGTAAIYGDATRRTWAALTQRCEPNTVRVSTRPLLSDGGRALDLGFQGRETWHGLSLDDLTAEARLAMPVLPSDLDGWSHTEPAPIPDQDLGPFLHGVGTPSAGTVSVCWRVLPVESGWGTDSTIGDLAPPRSRELIEIPVAEFRRFVAGHAIGAIADTDGVIDGTTDDTVDGDAARLVFRYTAAAATRIRSVREIRSGDTYVVDCRLGGLDRWGWAPRSREPVIDVWDAAHEPESGRVVLRLDMEVLALYMGIEAGVLHQRTVVLDDDTIDPDDAVPIGELLTRCERAYSEGHAQPDSACRAFLARLRAVAVETHDVAPNRRGPAWLVERCDQLLDAVDRCRLITVGRSPTLVTGGGRDVDSSDDTETSSSVAAIARTLADHLADVAREVDDVCRAMGVSDVDTRALRLGAVSHDLGKADLRFQTMLHNGDAIAAELAEVPLAKSVSGRVQRSSGEHPLGWPRGYRHEDISAALLEQLRLDDPSWFQDADIDLVIHLAQTHHGWGRPFPKAALDPAPQEVTVAVPDRVGTVTATPPGVVDLTTAERFDRLQRRYGWWGLAWREAIVRLADIKVSKGYELGSTPAERSQHERTAS